MEILILVLLYYLSQNPSFAESVKPLMTKIKDSEQMLNFLNDLSKFSGAFGGFSASPTNPTPNEGARQEKKEHTDSRAEKGGCENGEAHSAAKEENKNPQSPTQGIADEFIQNILDSYLKKR